MNELVDFLVELSKLSDVNEMRLNPKPMVPVPKAAPLPSFAIKHGFATSQFSGVLGFGPFPAASSIPPWREPPLRKQSGPPGDSQLESTGDLPVPDGRAHLRKNANVTSPSGQLQTSQGSAAAPRLKAPGPSIAQQSKPRGFGVPLPGLAKVALSPSNLRVLGGAGLGALAGGVAGRATADQGHGFGGAVGGAVRGAGLGAAAGYAAPRIQAGMKSGLGFKGSVKALGQDTGARVNAAFNPPVPKPTVPAPISTHGLTAAGGASSAQSYAKLSPATRDAFERSKLVGAGVPPPMAMQLAMMSKEKGESSIGSIARHAFQGGDTPLNTPVARKLVSDAERSMPTRIEKAAATKVALIERLVRLGATPIPGTPKLLMKSRTPQELSALQHNVSNAWNSRVTEPLMRRAEPLLNRLPKGKVQDLARTGAKLVAEDPVGTVVTNAIPIPGAHPGYLALKRGLEGVIDRIAPIDR